MADSRRFKVTASLRVWKTVEYLVEAESFDAASDSVCNGYWDDIYDESEDDSDIDEITGVECYECDETEGDCECAKNGSDVFAELGL